MVLSGMRIAGHPAGPKKPSGDGYRSMTDAVCVGNRQQRPASLAARGLGCHQTGPQPAASPRIGHLNRAPPHQRLASDGG
jgi:hypothetical protein